MFKLGLDMQRRCGHTARGGECTSIFCLSGGSRLHTVKGRDEI